MAKQKPHAEVMREFIDKAAGLEPDGGQPLYEMATVPSRVHKLGPYKLQVHQVTDLQIPHAFRIKVYKIGLQGIHYTIDLRDDADTIEFRFRPERVSDQFLTAGDENRILVYLRRYRAAYLALSKDALMTIDDRGNRRVLARPERQQ